MKRIAIITGASSGIGKEFVNRVDHMGLDEMWLVALDIEGLNETARQCNTPTQIFACDLTKDDSIDNIVNKLNDEQCDVAWLFNVSGFGKFGRYDEIDVKQSANMVDLNCKALLVMTERVLPFMHEGGRIVQISSVAGWQPIPYIATYGATKAFVISYSRALNRELKSRKISVTTICPFWTKTKFFDRAKDTKAKNEVVTKYTAMYTPEYVADHAMRAAMKRKDLAVIGMKSKMQCLMVKLMPHKFVMSTWIRQQKLNKKYK